jgi:hypothetical protein
LACSKAWWRWSIVLREAAVTVLETRQSVTCVPSYASHCSAYLGCMGHICNGTGSQWLVMQRGVAAEGVTYRGAIGCSCKGQIPDQIAGYIVKR